jgi:hypothetical protein
MENLELLLSEIQKKHWDTALHSTCNLLIGLACLVLGYREGYMMRMPDGSLITINSVPKSQSYVDEYGVYHEAIL